MQVLGEEYGLGCWLCSQSQQMAHPFFELNHGSRS